MDQDVIDFIKTMGVGCRHPNDELFHEGNELSKINKIFGVHEIEDEEFCHKSYSAFSCHIPNCTFSCETVYEYDQHYNSCHRFSCSQCNKYLPTSHLLDLHLMETHDAYFLELSNKKPMFQCFLQECKTLFQTPQERKDHCIGEHGFPSNFRFDNYKISNPRKIRKSKKKETNDNCVEMEISTDKTSDSGQERKFSSITCHTKKRLGNKRKPVLDMKCFVKDMRDSLQVESFQKHSSQQY